jgi:hypothetical protein
MAVSCAAQPHLNPVPITATGYHTMWPTFHPIGKPLAHSASNIHLSVHCIAVQACHCSSLACCTQPFHMRLMFPSLPHHEAHLHPPRPLATIKRRCTAHFPPHRRPGSPPQQPETGSHSHLKKKRSCSQPCPDPAAGWPHPRCPYRLPVASGAPSCHPTAESCATRYHPTATATV